MSEIDSTRHTGVRTTFMPWKTVDMDDREYRDLDRQGLIVHDPEPVPVELGEPPAEKLATPKPRRRDEDANLPASD